MELRTLVQEELQQNPLLEEIPRTSRGSRWNLPRARPVADTTRPRPRRSGQEFKEEFEVLSKLDEEWREYFSQTSSFRSRSCNLHSLPQIIHLGFGFENLNCAAHLPLNRNHVLAFFYCSRNPRNAYYISRICILFLNPFSSSAMFVSHNFII